MKSKELFLATAALSAVVASVFAKESRPNILLIITDQQSFDMVQAISGSKYISTPNMDRLVKRGYSFANCYSANPVSVPSRFALLTGESPAEYGFRHNDFSHDIRKKVLPMVTQRAMGVLFKNAGYETFYGGKVHVPFSTGGTGITGDGTQNYGFDTYLTSDFRNMLAETGVKFFKERKSNKPFLICLSFINPHDICAAAAFLNNPFVDDFQRDKGPLEVVKGYHRLADKKPVGFFDSDESAPLPKNMAIPEAYYNCISRAEEWSKVPDLQWRRYIWVYHRLVELVDKEIGLVLDALEQSPYADNTNIIFTADHGEMGGSHRLTTKGIFFEECQKIPFVFVGKGIKNRIDRTTPVCNGWDLLPTMCEMAGIPVPKQLRGMSLWNTITKDEPLKRDYLYLEAALGFQILQQGRYKFSSCEDTKAGRYEIFFDLEKDPLELNNMIANPAYKNKAVELRALLDKEMASRNIEFTSRYSNRSNAVQKPNATRERMNVQPAKRRK